MRHIPHPQSWRFRDIAFLTLAVVAHMALLLIPLQPWDRDPTSSEKYLKVKLQSLPVLPEPEPAMGNIAASEPAEPVERKRRSAQIVLEEIPTPEEVAEQPNDPNTAEQLSARRLRSLLGQSGLLAPESETSQQLGAAKQYQAPANWSRSAGAPYLAEFDNRFNGMTVPEKVEIVDRWLAADGSHNVVINTPSGETLCGRAAAYNPMQTLLEPIMLFGLCAGGGKRTFVMPERYNKGR
jgi:hypothetical protein